MQETEKNKRRRWCVAVVFSVFFVATLKLTREPRSGHIGTKNTNKNKF